MGDAHRVTAEPLHQEANGDLAGRGGADSAAGSPTHQQSASDRRVSEGGFHGMPMAGEDSPYRPGMRPKVPYAPGGGGGAAAPELLSDSTPRRAAARSPSAAGPQTFGAKYMPFAAGFSHQAGEAAVYRSSRLHAINPTAAVTEDTSYLYTLDSGRETPATRAANPNKGSEHVRNTAAAASAQGGFMGKVFAPIR